MTAQAREGAPRLFGASAVTSLPAVSGSSVVAVDPTPPPAAATAAATVTATPATPTVAPPKSQNHLPTDVALHATAEAPTVVDRIGRHAGQLPTAPRAQAAPHARGTSHRSGAMAARGGRVGTAGRAAPLYLCMASILTRRPCPTDAPAPGLSPHVSLGRCSPVPDLSLFFGLTIAHLVTYLRYYRRREPNTKRLSTQDFERAGGYDQDTRIARVLGGLGFTEDAWQTRCA